MKQITDKQKVKERMNELHLAGQALSRWASMVYAIAGADLDSEQLFRIIQQKRKRDYFAVTEAAHHVLMETCEKKGKRLTVRDEDRIKFKKLVANDVVRFPKTRYFRADAFQIRKGRVEVKPGIEREIVKDHTREVDDEFATMNSWAASFISVINNCPEANVRHRLGKFALQIGHELEGARIEADKNDVLQVVDG